MRISGEDLFAGRLSVWPRFSREEVPWLLKPFHYGFRVDEKYPDLLKVGQATKSMAKGTLHARTGDRLEEAAGGR